MELRFPNIKNIEDYKKLRSYGNIPKQLLLLLYNVKLWYMYYGKKNYGTMGKTMVRWKKICYYTSVPKTMEI